jgi:hypothetical protein
MARYDHLIDQLYPDDASRRIARAAVEQFSSVPGMDPFIEGGLREFAHVNSMVAAGEKSPEEGRELLFSTMEGFGLPPHLANAVGQWYDATLASEVEQADDADADAEGDQPRADPEPAPAQAQPPAAPPHPAPAVAPAQPAGPSRAELQAEIARHEANMRQPENSPEWRAYWKLGGSGQYLRALQAMEVMPENTIAGGAAAPSPSAPAAPEK